MYVGYAKLLLVMGFTSWAAVAAIFADAAAGISPQFIYSLAAVAGVVSCVVAALSLIDRKMASRMAIHENGEHRNLVSWMESIHSEVRLLSRRIDRLIDKTPEKD